MRPIRLLAAAIACALWAASPHAHAENIGRSGVPMPQVEHAQDACGYFTYSLVVGTINLMHDVLNEPMRPSGVRSEMAERIAHHLREHDALQCNVAVLRGVSDCLVRELETQIGYAPVVIYGRQLDQMLFRAAVQMARCSGVRQAELVR